MKIIVQKYGGTSVGSIERIKAVAKRIKRYIDNGYSVVVVVSAMGKSTDRLVDLAKEITSNPSKREMDVLLSTGEQVTIALLSMALHEIGQDAQSFTGSQVKVLTDGNFSNAKIESIDKTKLVESLEKGNVVIVAGFQGIDSLGNITTLGRGGSDTSAVALASILNSRDCEILTDVDGVYAADPRVVSNPKKLNEISYEEMLELSRLGASVLHSRSVEFAKKYNVRLHVRSSFEEVDGTIVMPRGEMMENFLISGITSKVDEAKITIRNIPDNPGIASRVFDLLGDNKIYVNMIVQSTGHDNYASISFTVLRDELDRTLTLCKGLVEELGASPVEHKEDIAIVSVVGVGMLSSYGVAGRFFDVISNAGVNIDMISTSEIAMSCVIDEKYAKDIVQAIHKEFLENIEK